MANIVELKSIRSTYLYSQLNKSGDFDNNIKTLIEKGVVPTNNELERQFSTINSYYKFPLKTNVMDAVEAGAVKPMMFPKGITAQHKIPSCLPFILMAGGGDVKAIAIIDNYAAFDDTTNLVTIDPMKLYTFLETAYVARGIQKFFAQVRSNTTMYVDAANVYSHMFIRQLNKKFALNINKTAYQKVMYCAAKFFLINVLQLQESQMINNYALKNSPDVPETSIQRIDDVMHEAAAELGFEGNPYKDISAFISSLARSAYLIINGLDQITVREYTKEFISMFNNSVLFALEHLTYFIFNVFATVNGAFLNNQYIFKDVMGHSGNSIYGYICNAVKRT